MYVQILSYFNEKLKSYSENWNILEGNHQIATVETVYNLGALMDKHLSYGQLYASRDQRSSLSSLELSGESGSFLQTVHPKY